MKTGINVFCFSFAFSLEQYLKYSWKLKYFAFLFHCTPDSVFRCLKSTKMKNFVEGKKKVIFIRQAASVACEEVLDILSPLVGTVAHSAALEKAACNL